MDAIGSALAVVGPIAVMIAFVLAPIALIVGLLWVARIHGQGRRTRFDGLFTGMARANRTRNELTGIPSPDPQVPEPPGPRRRRRTRRPG